MPEIGGVIITRMYAASKPVWANATIFSNSGKSQSKDFWRINNVDTSGMGQLSRGIWHAQSGIPLDQSLQNPVGCDFVCKPVFPVKATY